MIGSVDGELLQDRLLPVDSRIVGVEREWTKRADRLFHKSVTADKLRRRKRRRQADYRIIRARWRVYLVIAADLRGSHLSLIPPLRVDSHGCVGVEFLHR